MDISLEDQVKAARQAGTSEEGIRQALTIAGHDPEKVEDAIKGKGIRRRFSYKEISPVGRLLIVLLLIIFLALIFFNALFFLNRESNVFLVSTMFDGIFRH